MTASKTNSSDRTLSSEALEAADEIIVTLREKDNSEALAVKAEALYNMGNFEHALLCFHRALRSSTVRERAGLKHGIKRTELAVTNAVGTEAGQYFRHLDDILVSGALG